MNTVGICVHWNTVTYNMGDVLGRTTIACVKHGEVPGLCHLPIRFI